MSLIPYSKTSDIECGDRRVSTQRLPTVCVGILKDWSLITGRGGGGGVGLQNGRGGGYVKFYPYEKGGEKSFGHAEEGPTSFGVVFLP